MSTPGQFVSAIQDFRSARSRANLKEVLARLTGDSTQLLSYEEVRQKLKAQGSAEIGLHDIPLDAIVGSVGRYTEFTRDFLPRHNVDEQRWAMVKVATEEMVGLAPIEVYQLGEVYFVKDGNHRVSVARQMGATHIQAYVTEVRTRVPIPRDIRPDNLILKTEYVEFLQITRLDELRPEADLSVTVPGQYQILLEHIAVHRYFMGIDLKRDISLEEAITDWYDAVYLPLIQAIREKVILRSFPNRTETDLYLWIAEHRAAIEKELGWMIPTDQAINILSEQLPPKLGIMRLGGKILDPFAIDPFAPGFPPGQWRKERLADYREDRLFSEILVPVSGEPEGWCGLDQALVIAQREGALIHGLHVVPTEADIVKDEAIAVKSQFHQRCQKAGIRGELVLATGEVSRQICLRSRWTDLVVTNLIYPPPVQLLAKLGSSFRDIIIRCTSPILAAPKTFTPLSHALLAFDGSPKAQEALFIAAYMAGCWNIQLVVVTVIQNEQPAPHPLTLAWDYLDSHGVTAKYVERKGPVAKTILKTSDENSCDLLIMGGYGHSPVLEVVLGSAVDQVLRASKKPVLICR